MKGIKCTSNEVNAILAGDKGQIRLVIKPQPNLIRGSVFAKSGIENEHGNEIRWPHQIGDLVFVKESYYNPFSNTYYKADDTPELRLAKWKPAQHMKQHQSRITLRIKDISVERLQSISCADYFKETGRRPISHMDLDCDTPDPRNDFANYWNATHKKPEEKWEANPWIWKIEFEVVK